MYGASGDESPLGEEEYQDVCASLAGYSGLVYQLPRNHKCACHLPDLGWTADVTAVEAVKHIAGSLSLSLHPLYLFKRARKKKTQTAFKTADIQEK